MSAYNFVVSGPKFTIFLFNAGDIVLVKVVYSLSISSSVSKTFVLRLESFLKSRRIKGAVPFKPCTQFIMPRQRHVMCRSFVGLHP